MPEQTSQVDWELALLLPLGALANQLVKIEGDLRFLSMKASEQAHVDGPRPIRAVDARVDLIHETLDSIKLLLVRLQGDIHPREPRASSTDRESTRFTGHKSSAAQED